MPPRIIEKNPRADGTPVPRTLENWRNGELIYSHVDDELTAESKGPEAEAAQARLETRKLLAMNAARNQS